MAISGALPAFQLKMIQVLADHGLPVDNVQQIFSADAIRQADEGNLDACAQQMRDFLATNLAHILSDTHAFLEEPWVRKMVMPDGQLINIAIINRQSAEWYGTELTIAAFDFLLEPLQLIFDRSRTFLDLGGHQFVWSTYYALRCQNATVVTFEPSILNVLIGLFNCMLNGVIERIFPIPFAVASSNPLLGVNSNSENEKMLVDFITVPFGVRTLNTLSLKGFDFIKVDIEGYEYDLLSDSTFASMIKNSKGAHFELHLGHLARRGTPLEECMKALRSVSFTGFELHSGKEMYEFLETCDPNGFHAFVLSQQIKDS
jgi:FkbM family methyltransferase